MGLLGEALRSVGNAFISALETVLTRVFAVVIVAVLVVAVVGIAYACT